MNLAFTTRTVSPKTMCFLFYYFLPLDYTAGARTNCFRSTEEGATDLTGRKREETLSPRLNNKWDIARKKPK